MDDELLRKIATEALQRIRASVECHTLHLAQRISAWIQSLCPDLQFAMASNGDHRFRLVRWQLSRVPSLAHRGLGAQRAVLCYLSSEFASGVLCVPSTHAP